MVDPTNPVAHNCGLQADTITYLYVFRYIEAKDVHHGDQREIGHPSNHHTPPPGAPHELKRQTQKQRMATLLSYIATIMKTTPCMCFWQRVHCTSASTLTLTCRCHADVQAQLHTPVSMKRFLLLLADNVDVTPAS